MFTTASGPTTTTPPSRGDRSGAVWVTATGALLLLAAATTFVAVRWDQLHDWQKFAALVVVTQLLLVAGWVGRQRVPATAAATFSLGAALIPLDAWTIAAAGAGDWHRGLFAGGTVAVLAIPIARRWFDTAALRWAWVAAVPIAVVGSAAWFGFPPPAVVVAALGLVAVSAGHQREGLSWLAIGSVTPLLTLAGPLLPFGRGVLTDLGLAGAAIPWTTTATAVLVVAAVVLMAERLGRTELVAVGLALATADLAAALVVGEAGRAGWWISSALIILGLEIAAIVASDDPFWAGRTASLAGGGEALSVVAGVLLLQLQLASAFGTSTAMTPAAASLSSVMLALAWLLSDDRAGRRLGRPRGDLLRGDPSTGASFAVAGFASLALVTMPIGPVGIALALVALGAVFLLTGRSGGSVIGPVLATVPPLLTLGNGAGVVVGMVLGLAVVALGARRERAGGIAVALSGVVAATVALDAVGTWLDVSDFGSHPVSHRLLLSVVAAGLAAGSLAATRQRLAPALLPWSVALLAVGVSALPAVDLSIRIAAPSIAIAWLLAEAARRRHPLPALGAAFAGPALSAALLTAAGYRPPQLGIGLAVVAIALVGMSLAAGRATRRPLLTAAGLHVLIGAAVASNSPGPLGVIVTIAGLLLVTLAVVDGVVVLAYNGAVLALLGTWQTLSGYDVHTAEAYLAPLALVLLAAGAHARSARAVTSWIAYTPPVLVLGVPAVALRLAGETGWHAVIAGGVAVAAVAAGSWWRLAAPLFLGSALLAAVTANETLSRTAGAPTWIWLALGGCVLLSAGVTMELRGLGPIESGRKVVQLVAERFE